jgi:molybdate transport system substrate-binding protein
MSSTKPGSSSDAITVLSSMATKGLLAELARSYELRSGRGVLLESVGGVDAERRVRAGERFDVVVLARHAVDKLLAIGRLVAGSAVDLVCSGVAVAVPAGAARPEIGSEDALERAVLSARSIGCSTGPSGVRLAGLFERWGILEEVRERIVTPPPGVAVGTLLSRGEVELGFQQLSELLHLEGVDVLGPLPASVQIVTTFSAGIGSGSTHLESARALLDFMASPAAAGAKSRHGMASA